MKQSDSEQFAGRLLGLAKPPAAYCLGWLCGIVRGMTALRELERQLSEHGCEQVRHGSRHDVWRSPVAELPVTLPRRRERMTAIVLGFSGRPQQSVPPRSTLSNGVGKFSPTVSIGR